MFKTLFSKIFSLFLLASTTSSCMMEGREQGGFDSSDATIIRVDEPDQDLYLSEVVNGINYIPLETCEDCMVGRVDKALFVEDKIFLLENVQKQVLCFSEKGKFLFKVGEKGRGPGQHGSCLDFFIDEQAEQIALKDDTGRLLYYDLEGNYLKAIRVGLDALAFQQDQNSNTLYGSTMRNPSIKEESCHELLVFDQAGKIVDRKIPYDCRHNLFYGTLWGMHPFHKNLYGETIFKNHYTDTVYNLTKEEVSYILDFGEKSWPKEHYRTQKNLGKNIPGKARSDAFYLETELGLILNYSLDKKQSLIFYSNKSGALKNGRPINDIDFTAPSFFKPSNRLVSTPSAHFFLDKSDKRSAQLQNGATPLQRRAIAKADSIALTLREGDNPVICLMELKEF